MSNLNGDQFPLKGAIASYLRRWYDGLYADTKSMQEFVARGFPHGVQYVPGRMVDQATTMLAAYQKNDNAPQGRNTLLPVVLVAVAKDYSPVAPEWGRQVGRQLVRIEDGGSIYGYRQAMHEKRVQIAVFAADEATANSLAAQLTLFLGEVPNRTFMAQHTFGQYTVNMPVTLESPDVPFMSIDTEQNNLTILAGDLTLKAQIPYFDAPKAGEPNDGSTNNPPGYQITMQVHVMDAAADTEAVVSDNGTIWR